MAKRSEQKRYRRDIARLEEGMANVESARRKIEDAAFMYSSALGDKNLVPEGTGKVLEGMKQMLDDLLETAEGIQQDLMEEG